MERQYNITINLPEGDYKLFNGPLPMNNLNVALESIKTIYHFNVKKDGNKIILATE